MRKSKTDWKRMDSMSDEELTRNAMSDADNPPLDNDFFAKARPVELPLKKSKAPYA